MEDDFACDLLGFREVDAPFRRAAAHEDVDDVAFPHVELEHILRIRLCVPKSGIAQAIHGGFAVVDALVILLDLRSTSLCHS